MTDIFIEGVLDVTDELDGEVAFLKARLMSARFDLVDTQEMVAALRRRVVVFSCFAFLIGAATATIAGGLA